MLVASRILRSVFNSLHVGVGWGFSLSLEFSSCATRIETAHRELLDLTPESNCAFL